VKPSHPRWMAAALLVAALTACGTAGGQQTTPPSPRPEQGDAAAMARARADSARLPWTEADARFMTNMIGHHAQAIVMARLAPTHTTTNSILTLAARIINAQEDEIGTMQRWLRDRNRPVPDPAAMLDMAAMGHDHAMMPGMLTPAQMRELEQARGTNFDRLFLTYMIQHHRGATQMVSELFGTHGAGQDETVFKFASDVNVDQETEIARMGRMLADILLGPAPATP
jgi:uncharacterized protein (DUF305 family)